MPFSISSMPPAARSWNVPGEILTIQAAIDTAAHRDTVMVAPGEFEESFRDCAGYTAAKSGQLALGRVLREEGRGVGIRVTNLSPGAVATAIWDDRPGFDRSKMLAPPQLAPGRRCPSTRRQPRRS